MKYIEVEELIRFYHNCFRDAAEAAKKYLPEATPRIRKTLTGYIRGCEKYMDCQDPDDCDIQLMFLHATAKTLTRPRSPRTLEEQEIIEALPFDSVAPEALQRYAIAPIYQILQDRVIALQTDPELRRLHLKYVKKRDAWGDIMRELDFE